MNVDFHRDWNNEESNGAYYQLSQTMYNSLLKFALSIVPEVRKRGCVAVNW